MNTKFDIRIERYSGTQQHAWDELNRNSKNGHFIFYRDYMDYHSDRFDDHSLLFYQQDKLCALLPAHQQDSILLSHQGLTFGGMITTSTMLTPVMLEIFEQLLDYLRSNSFTRLVYKSIPHIYHRNPAQEDLYALFRNQAILVRRDVTVVIEQAQRLEYQKRRQRNIQKARQSKLKVHEIFAPEEWKEFWDLLANNLQDKYAAVPVHSLQEIRLLRERFQESIHLHVASMTENSEIVAGVVIYEHSCLAHAQYIASSEKGRENGALDLIFQELIEKVYADKKYFDFGISTEQQGQFLNEGLINFKEGFGARAVVQDMYELDVASPE